MSPRTFFAIVMRMYIVYAAILQPHLLQTGVRLARNLSEHLGERFEAGSNGG